MGQEEVPIEQNKASPTPSKLEEANEPKAAQNEYSVGSEWPVSNPARFS